MNYLKIAYIVLAEYDEPLSVGDIVDISRERHLITTAGKKSKAALATALYRDIRRRGSASFFQVNRGKFYLNKEVKRNNKEIQTVDLFEKKRIYSNKSMYKWGKTAKSVFTCYRENDPYEQYCPRVHLIAIMVIIANLIEENLQIGSGMIVLALEKNNIVPEWVFNRNTESYKVFMALAILEMEGFLGGKNRNHRTYTPNVSAQQIRQWIEAHI